MYSSIATCPNYSTLVNQALTINEAMAGWQLFSGSHTPMPAGQNSTFRISPEPFFIDQQTAEAFIGWGSYFLAFYQAANELYQKSVRGKAPAFIHEYLDIGKPEIVVEYARQNRYKHDLPLVIRPDVIPTEDGFIVTELDSVPGGMGLLDFLAKHYAAMNYNIVGGADGMIQGFTKALRSLSADDKPCVAIVVSDESADYLGEMEWLAQRMRDQLNIQVCHPRDLVFKEDGLYLFVQTTQQPGQLERIDILYRFFELFDLKNIPKSDLILYAIRKQLLAVTPPIKAYLEEKSLFALFHHPILRSSWQRLLSEPAFANLSRLLPYTWVLDPRALPPHALIPDLHLGNEPVTSFTQLRAATKKERQMVIKPSGFSAQAWGSRGVLIGHDEPKEVWEAGVDAALADFYRVPHILQEFHKGKKVKATYYDFQAGKMKCTQGRARLCPYYYVIGGKAVLAGVLATIVPLDKKVIHGMVDAIMMPVAVK